MPNATITTIDIGRLRLDLTDAYDLPEGHPDGGPADIPLLCHHVRLGAHSVLVDAPACEFTGERVRYAVPGYAPPPPLRDQLVARGIDPDSIEDVVITHAHFDHLNALIRRDGGRAAPCFPRARHHLGAGDLVPEVLDEVGEEVIGVLRSAGLLRPTDGAHRLGEGLSILPAPGETPGHQILHVRSDRREAFITGDLYHQRFELHDDARHASWADAEQSVRSKRALVDRAAGTGALVYFAHIDEPHRIERTGDGVRWIPAPEGHAS
jgi:glyoxylase-like metal-dependent hydrolase (beta-lactamase superfamily II)